MMNTGHQYGQQGGSDIMQDAGFVLILLALLIFGGWWLGREYILWFSFYTSYYVFKGYAFVVDYIPFLLFEGERRELLGAVKAIPDIDPTKHGVGSLFKLFAIHGYMLRWIIIPLLLLNGYRTFKGVTRFKYRRNIRNVYDLIDIQAKNFVASALIKDKFILREHPYKGVFATYALPIDWALDHQLLWASRERLAPDTKVDETKMKPLKAFTPDEKLNNFEWRRNRLPNSVYVLLNHDAAHEAFAKQLGGRWTGWRDLPPLEQGLYAIFCLQGVGRQKEAQKLINQIGFSFKIATFDKDGKILTPHHADLSGVDKILTTYADDPALALICEKHYHTISVLTETLNYARKKGRLMLSNILWVKWVHRTLFFSLCGQGGQCPYYEAAGIWAHMQFERRAGVALAVPHVAGAVLALREQLKKEAWIDPVEYGVEHQQQVVQDANRLLQEASDSAKAQPQGGAGGSPFGGGQQMMQQMIAQREAVRRREAEARKAKERGADGEDEP